MFNLGLFELTLFGIIALIVLGPEKLPTAARAIGRWYGKIRRASSRLQAEFANELNLLETQEQLKAELAKIRENEAALKEQMQALQRSVEKAEQNTKKTTEDSLNAWQTQSAEQDAHISMTKPMHYYWFFLGEYDRRRRLPPAPFLPNYQADPLLYQHQQQTSIL